MLSHKNQLNIMIILLCAEKPNWFIGTPNREGKKTVTLLFIGICLKHTRANFQSGGLPLTCLSSIPLNYFYHTVLYVVMALPNMMLNYLHTQNCK